MRVLVLNPFSRATKNVIRDVVYGCWCKGKRIGGATLPPFNLLEVATILRNEGNDVAFLDAQAEQLPIETFAKNAAGRDCVIISTSTMSFREDAGILAELKSRYPGLRTIIFGSHPTFMPIYSLNHPGVDIIVRREPEFIIRDLFRALNRGDETWSETLGIGFKRDGKPIVNGERPFDDDLDQLPFPDVSMLPSGIHYYNPLVRRMPYITTTTSKGCPAKCTFCTAPYFDGMKVRFQSADHVVREIEYFLANGIREVYFRDDTFFVWKNRDKELCREILKRELDVTWICNTRVATIRDDFEMLKMAQAAGCHTVKFGIESGDQQILNNIKKDYTLDEARRVFEWTHTLGLNTHAHVMLGNPGETAETIQKTIDFALELDPTTATFGICTPYPGTPLFDEVVKRCPEMADGTQTDLGKLHVQGLFNEHYTHLKRHEIEANVKTAYQRFYLRPSYVLRTLGDIKNIDDIKRVSIAAGNVVDFALRGE